MHSVRSVCSLADQEHSEQHDVPAQHPQEATSKGGSSSSGGAKGVLSSSVPSYRFTLRQQLQREQAMAEQKRLQQQQQQSSASPASSSSSSRGSGTTVIRLSSSAASAKSGSVQVPGSGSKAPKVQVLKVGSSKPLRKDPDVYKWMVAILCIDLKMSNIKALMRFSCIHCAVNVRHLLTHQWGQNIQLIFIY
jgi:hypothetical protein